MRDTRGSSLNARPSARPPRTTCSRTGSSRRVRGRSFVVFVVVVTAAIGVVGAQPGSPPRVFQRGGVDQAPRQWPLAPVPPDGQRVAPFFDGFYQNPDGTITLSFGYSNFNREQT